MDIENLVKITTIVRDEADISAVRTGRAALLGSHKPASILVVGGLSNAAWKVEVVAARNLSVGLVTALAWP
jgi:aldehyde:ferredoxin oxidoreductase